MTDQPEQPERRKDPPKIKLNGTNGNGIKKPDAPEELLTPAPGEEAPPQLKISRDASKAATSRVEITEGIPSQRKSETTKIDLSSADLAGGVQGSAPPKTTLKKGVPSAAKKDTSRIDLPTAEELAGKSPSAQAAAGQTMRVEVPEGIPSGAKKDTTKVDLASAQSSDTAKIRQTQEVPPATDKAEEEITKSLEDAYRAANEATMRIEIDEEMGIKEASGASIQRTTRVDLGEVLGKEDVFKKRAQGPGAKPKTMRIKRADVLSDDEIRSTQPVPTPPAPGMEGAQKGQTAQIDLPDDGQPPPPTRRKTIRIKRPDGSGGPVTKAPTGAPTAASVKAPTAAAAPAAREPGGIFAVTAILAFLVVAVLIYVLAAQIPSIKNDGTPYTESLPFPGKVI